MLRVGLQKFNNEDQLIPQKPTKYLNTEQSIATVHKPRFKLPGASQKEFLKQDR